MIDYSFTSKEGLLFLCYLTNYNINAIYQAVNDHSPSTLTDFYQAFLQQSPSSRNGKSQQSSDHHKRASDIDKALQQTTIALAKLRYHRVNIISYMDEDHYPNQLKGIKQPPPLLFVKGNYKSNQRMAAIVGTRQASKFADKMTRKIVDVVQESGLGILSGLALGIDTIAHRAALDKDVYTIAILPNSLDTVYPKSNFPLAVEILEKGGALISELPPEINRGKKSFVERNRLQTALSELVIPVELGAKSGTMHTVNFAKKQGKHVIVVQPFEQNQYLPQYEGIQTLIAKQESSPYENFHTVTNSAGLSVKLKGLFTSTEQMTLFS
ncbi:DNA-processing protein DprA [Tunicatimonas pelagia]|uniref:DNA-processing protein DprA n=1 Tax=Tunicatimonas pelagia TaxID=931531 RepID=UPI002666591B|nr:DNA-processing protein DprA [Tunicatimonas pelagia]WKN46433.1 DNA-protecting protein DprA [Tunicatimonas pelagia]